MRCLSSLIIDHKAVRTYYRAIAMEEPMTTQIQANSAETADTGSKLLTTGDNHHCQGLT